MNIDKMMSDIRGLKAGRHGCSLDDIAAIRDAVGGGEIATGANCFGFGFLQGQQAAKAEFKRERRQLMERDTSGWYIYLRRWLDRNIDNERLLDLVGVFARKLEAREAKRGSAND